MLRYGARASVWVTLLFVAGCADPPSKEMDQAQGAIDAARAAGADQYATTGLTAAERARVPAQSLRQPAARLKEATATLQKARETVAAGDYLGATAVLEGVNTQVEQALADVEAATTAHSSRRRRESRAAETSSLDVCAW